MKPARQSSHQDSPTGETETLTPHQRRTFRRRQAKIEAFEAAIAAGASKTQAARIVHIDPVTCWRYRRALSNRGLSALIPSKSTGRPRKIAQFKLGPAAVASVQKLTISLGGASRAWRAFASTPACSKRLAEFITSSARLPEYLLRAARPRRVAATIYRGEGFEFVVSNWSTSPSRPDSE